MGVSVLGFGFLAGILSILSPCVLPVLPLVFAPAGAAHRFGALALAAGLVTSFVVIGLFVATIGSSYDNEYWPTCADEYWPTLRCLIC